MSWGRKVVFPQVIDGVGNCFGELRLPFDKPPEVFATRFVYLCTLSLYLPG